MQDQKTHTSTSLLQIKMEKDQFTIFLKDNPTTGYAWSFSTDPVHLITLVEEHTEKLQTFTCGAGRIHQYTFTMEKPGNATLKFILHRCWEKKEPIETLYFHVQRNKTQELLCTFMQ